MKGMVLLLAVGLACLLVPAGELYALDTPFSVRSDQEFGDCLAGPDTDDHPWGGESRSSDLDGETRDVQLRLTSTISSVDIIYLFPSVYAYFESRFLIGRIERLEATSRQQAIEASPIQTSHRSHSGSERVR